MIPPEWTTEDAERESLDNAEPCDHHYSTEVCDHCGEALWK